MPGYDEWKVEQEMKDDKVYPFWADRGEDLMIFTFKANDLQKTEQGLIHAITYKIPQHVKRLFKKPSYSWGKDVQIDLERFLSVRIEEAASDIEPIMIPKSERYIRIDNGTHVRYDWLDGWIQIIQNDEYEPRALMLDLDEAKGLIGLLGQVIKDMEKAEHACEHGNIGGCPICFP